MQVRHTGQNKDDEKSDTESLSFTLKASLSTSMDIRDKLREKHGGRFRPARETTKSGIDSTCQSKLNTCNREPMDFAALEASLDPKQQIKLGPLALARMKNARRGSKRFHQSNKGAEQCSLDSERNMVETAREHSFVDMVPIEVEKISPIIARRKFDNQDREGNGTNGRMKGKTQSLVSVNEEDKAATHKLPIVTRSQRNARLLPRREKMATFEDTKSHGVKSIKPPDDLQGLPIGTSAGSQLHLTSHNDTKSIALPGTKSDGNVFDVEPIPPPPLPIPDEERTLISSSQLACAATSGDDALTPLQTNVNLENKNEATDDMAKNSSNTFCPRQSPKLADNVNDTPVKASVIIGNHERAKENDEKVEEIVVEPMCNSGKGPDETGIKSDSKLHSHQDSIDLFAASRENDLAFSSAKVSNDVGLFNNEKGKATVDFSLGVDYEIVKQKWPPINVALCNSDIAERPSDEEEQNLSLLHEETENNVDAANLISGIAPKNDEIVDKAADVDTGVSADCQYLSPTQSEMESDAGGIADGNDLTLTSCGNCNDDQQVAVAHFQDSLALSADNSELFSGDTEDCLHPHELKPMLVPMRNDDHRLENEMFIYDEGHMRLQQQNQQGIASSDSSFPKNDFGTHMTTDVKVGGSESAFVSLSSHRSFGINLGVPRDAEFEYSSSMLPVLSSNGTQQSDKRDANQISRSGVESVETLYTSFSDATESDNESTIDELKDEDSRESESRVSRKTRRGKLTRSESQDSTDDESGIAALFKHNILQDLVTTAREDLPYLVQRIRQEINELRADFRYGDDSTDATAETDRKGPPSLFMSCCTGY